MANPRRTMVEIRAAAAARKEQKAAARLARQQKRAASRKEKSLRSEAAQARSAVTALRKEVKRQAAADRRDAAERKRKAKENGYCGGVPTDIPRTVLMERLGTMPFAGAEAVPVTNTGGIAPETCYVDPLRAHRLVSADYRVNFVDPALTAGRQGWAVYSGACDTVEADIVNAIDAYDADCWFTAPCPHAPNFEDDLVEKMASGTASLEDLAMLALLRGVDIEEFFVAKVEEPLAAVEECKTVEDASDAELSEIVRGRKIQGRKDHESKKLMRKGLREIRRGERAKRNWQVEESREVIRSKRRAKQRSTDIDREREQEKHLLALSLERLEAKYGRWCRKTVRRKIVRWNPGIPWASETQDRPTAVEEQALEAYRNGPDLSAWRAWIMPQVERAEEARAAEEEIRAEAARKEAKAQHRAEKRKATATGKTSAGAGPMVDLVVCAPKKGGTRRIGPSDFTVL